MGRLDFVGVDLEHRSGIDLGVLRKQKILAAHPRVTAIGARSDQQAAAEGQPATALGQTAPDEVAARIGRQVTHVDRDLGVFFNAVEIDVADQEILRLVRLHQCERRAWHLLARKERPYDRPREHRLARA